MAFRGAENLGGADGGSGGRDGGRGGFDRGNESEWAGGPGGGEVTGREGALDGLRRCPDDNCCDRRVEGPLEVGPDDRGEEERGEEERGEGDRCEEGRCEERCEEERLDVG